MGDYGGGAPVIPHIQRMRSIRTPENNLLPETAVCPKTGGIISPQRRRRGGEHFHHQFMSTYENSH
ncbi:MAG: hypothetical protein CVV49_13275 [Spirochaetae bacterium HGW-Spirochaetae-5]|nr:MAG: hypothetical protein CVV49_13275 [Spirochaetae bacterium HGW-Spirochaetae-5]